MFTLTPHRLTFFAIFAIFMPYASLAAEEANEDTYDEKSIIQEATDFIGKGAEGIADVIEKIFAEKGRPNGFIKGQEASGAFVVGARYGDGTLQLKNGGETKVHWTGPSAGFDFGGNVSKVFVLVYHLPNPDALFQRFPEVEGSFYWIAGISANYHQSGDIILAPIRLGGGLRAGVNVGYMKYTRDGTWNPF
ncbi:MAG: DUF1134 domain-containing protein [Gammaproteobacteria bacterium]|nr:DUF1134 domain-containing protein [Gammaproteobacteria bacterium]